MAKDKHVAPASVQPKIVSLATAREAKKTTKAYYKHELPFVATDQEGNPLNLWAVVDRRDPGNDYRMGIRLAFDYLSWSRRKGALEFPDLVQVLDDMYENKGHNSGLGIGFIGGIHYAAVFGLHSLHVKLSEMDEEALTSEIEAVRRKTVAASE